ncbi:phosphatase PAP2 family protein [soil metagenome]
MKRPVIFHLLLGCNVLGLLTAAGYLFFVATRWGQEFDYMSFKGHLELTPTLINWSTSLMYLVGVPAMLVAVAGLVGISLYRRRYLLGFLALLAIGCAIAGTATFKKTLPRPSVGGPSLHEWENLVNETYPSGHTTFPTVIALAFLLVSSPRWRPWVACAGALVATLFGFGVIFVGGHRPADPMGAILWSTFCMSFAAAAALRFRGDLAVSEPNSHALTTGLTLCLVPAIITLFSTRDISPTFLPLFPMLAVISLTAFACFAWLAWLLSGEDAAKSEAL